MMKTKKIRLAKLQKVRNNLLDYIEIAYPSQLKVITKAIIKDCNNPKCSFCKSIKL